LTVGSIVLGCQRLEPPGAGARQTDEPALVGAHASAAYAGATRAPARAASGPAPGTFEDNLPFPPTGKKLVSIAWRTWVYTDTGSKRTRFGYLRAGALVDRRDPPIVNEGCTNGWYRINPRGFVCVGKGASLDLADPAARIASVRATRGAGLPYRYAMARDNPPLLYFRLPTRAETNHVEGEAAFEHARVWRAQLTTQGLGDWLGEPGPPPDFLMAGAPVVKPYGVAQRLHYSVHAGRAAPDSGFALMQVFLWNDRVHGLTTEHDIIALDRTRLVKPSEFQGVELLEGEALPVAFVQSYGAPSYTLDAASDLLRAQGALRPRQAIKLTGARRNDGRASFWETRDGSWIVADGMRMLMPRDSFPSFATGDRKWLDISINQQSLVAYRGRTPVYATLVSTGRGGLADPEKSQATVRGTFMVYQKDVSSTMDGEEDRSDGYALQDVPFVQYFHKGYALHGTYWHDEFGKLRSHGCVNLSPRDAAWLFEWTDPNVPSDWHGVINKERGTVVFIRP
jgi:hypothetical protein